MNKDSTVTKGVVLCSVSALACYAIFTIANQILYNSYCPESKIISTPIPKSQSIEDRCQIDYEYSDSLKYLNILYYSYILLLTVGNCSWLLICAFIIKEKS